MHDYMGFKTTVAKASSITNSLRTTIPAGIVHQFNLKDGDKLDWTLKVEKGQIGIIVKPENAGTS
jgi:bifunctional DNA-binding transcriptional regulator/antitoxin component of YhaV-PrlF toxin-antitoxin module